MSRGRTAVVTGAGSGMGQQAAVRLARRGYRVVATDVNEAGLAATAEQAGSGSGAGNLTTVRLDVCDAAAVRALFDEVDVDSAPLALTYHAAGIARVGDTVGLGTEAIHRLMDVNYGGTVNVSIPAVEHLRARGGGTLVNFASLAGWVPSKRMTAYNATKFAVVGFTEGLYLEAREYGVDVVCVCPPAVKTPMLTDFFDDANARKSGAVTTEKVLDAIDTAIKRHKFLVLPDASSRVAYTLRRHFPATTRWLTGLERANLVRS